jgi:hypothetical protein
LLPTIAAASLSPPPPATTETVQQTPTTTENKDSEEDLEHKLMDQEVQMGLITPAEHRQYEAMQRNIWKNAYIHKIEPGQ